MEYTLSHKGKVPVARSEKRTSWGAFFVVLGAIYHPTVPNAPRCLRGSGVAKSHLNCLTGMHGAHIMNIIRFVNIYSGRE